MQRAAGWVILIAALGMMAGLLSPEVTALHEWGEAIGPGFVGKALGHFAVVVAAFIGGKLLPQFGSEK